MSSNFTKFNRGYLPLLPVVSTIESVEVEHFG